jgi:phosphatidylinositol dimannoside acyltransferase
VYAAYRAGAAAAGAIPSALAVPTARSLGRALGYAMVDRRRQSARHLARASGGRLRGLRLEHAVNGAFDSYGRYWLEMFQLPHVGTSEITRHFDVEGYEHIEAGLEQGNGVILALPHLGGWEWAGAWICLVQGHKLLVVVEPVEPPELFEWFQEVRAAMGMEVVALGDHAATRALAALRANRVVCLVSDRDLSGDGIDVEFFGERTTLPGGPALLAVRAGAPILPVAVYFGGGLDHHAVVRPPLDTTRRGSLRDDVARITQDLAHEFERLIERAPEQWHLMQPNWPSDRDGTRR